MIHATDEFLEQASHGFINGVSFDQETHLLSLAQGGKKVRYRMYPDLDLYRMWVGYPC